MGQTTYLKDVFNSGWPYFILPVTCAMILGFIIWPFRRQHNELHSLASRSNRQRIIELFAVLLTIVFINRILPRHSNNKALLYSIVVAGVAFREWRDRLDNQQIIARKAASLMLATIELIAVMFAIAWILLYSIQPFVD